MRNRLITSLAAAILTGAAVFAQTPSVRWNVSVEGDEILFTAKIPSGQHIYDTRNEFNPTTVVFTSLEGVELSGGLEERSEASVFKGDRGFSSRAVFAQKVSGEGRAEGIIRWQACTDEMCGMPEEEEFSVTVGAPSEVIGTAIEDPEEERSAGGGLWALLIEAILWGFAMLLTPCVFPMVPMTVSFFLKGSDNPASGRFKAFMYGLFIVLLYTVPISLIILLTRVVGGDAVTADIFNWLSTHWLPNILFFVVFMIFAASFFGAFEITLPASWTTKTDAKSGRGGLGGVFFMALTLVLVSFSCTGPIVGSVLLKSTHGEFWTPMVTMLAFSIAFALPFTIFALFPQLLKKMKGGGWLNSVKVVLGFVEIALGLKFLSIADQTYGWGILNREVYLAIWIVVFSLLGFYLLGKLRFKYDSPLEHISLVRLVLAIGVFTFVVWMIPGMFGAPLKALSGYLPPMESQEFVLSSGAPSPIAAPGNGTVELPQGLHGYETLEEGLAEASRTGKPVFVDITGKGCTNCREMEARVWSDPRVRELLDKRFVLVALHCDDHTKAPESSWLTTDSGKVLKEWGKINSYIARTRFNANAQPTYVLLTPDGEIIAERNYNLDTDAYVAFLKKAL
ncbi:MAG: thioredoxin family protein [Bacteroidales bacterium]|nr:thioredoxin family protein [Bacteroidales bacterium]